jgi:hypothetical protein
MIGYHEEDYNKDDLKWEKEVDRVTKQRNLTTNEAVNWQLWRLKTSN